MGIPAICHSSDAAALPPALRDDEGCSTPSDQMGKLRGKHRCRLTPQQ